MLEYWIKGLGHCFGCSLLLGTPSNSLCKSASSVLSYLLRRDNSGYPDLALCLTILNLSPTQNACLFTYVNNASVCVVLSKYCPLNKTHSAAHFSTIQGFVTFKLLFCSVETVGDPS